MDGIVYWITGLSGAGKTTIGRELYKQIREQRPNVVLLDGDQLREVFANDLGYTKEERYQCAMRYSRICRMLAEQDLTVICCTISMFDQVREWNRQNMEQYREIYVRVPMEVLRLRNQKGLYSGVKHGITEDVVGEDLELQLPQNPDLILDNDGSNSLVWLVAKIGERFEII